MGPYKLPTTGKALTDLTVLPTVSKSRKPRFELHLKIYDLNNIPLSSGHASAKWHLPYSIHSEHRGRTSKHAVANHRVEFNYAKIVPLRLVIDKNNRLGDYPIEFEITQEFSNNGVGRDEKIVLGKITLNLAEYVAESEAILRETRPLSSSSDAAHWDYGAQESRHTRQRSSLSGKATISSFGTGLGVFDSGDGGESMLSTSPSAASGPPPSAGSSASTGAALVEEGVTRRYLMQESKINGTLKISVLMVQVDGDRGFIAPQLKSAPVFGGIAGIMASGEVLGGGVVSLRDESDEASYIGGARSMSSRATASGRDTSEVQDVYRRALAASWACEQGELPADECIEDIFNGGDGFRRSGNSPDSFSPAGATPGQMLPSNTSLHSVTEDQDKDSEEGSGSSDRKKGYRFIPKLPLRRKTAPANSTSAQKTLRKANSSNALRKKLRVGVLFDNSGNNTSSGEDGGTTSSGSADRPSTAMTYSPHGDDDDGFEANATLRPYDLREARMQQAASSDPQFTAARQHEREDSVLSDRTIRGPGGTFGFDVPRSARSSPGPAGLVSSTPVRDDSYASLALAAAKNNTRSQATLRAVPIGTAQKSSGRNGGSGSNSGAGSGSGSGIDEDRKRNPRSVDVDENDVRENFVAWSLSSSVAAS